jgi:hypothetical protein
MSNIHSRFELDDEQHARFEAWSKHHWDVVHKNFIPPDRSGFGNKFIFAPTSAGDNVHVECAWCAANTPQRVVVLTKDDDGEFIYQYDDNWIQKP